MDHRGREYTHESPPSFSMPRSLHEYMGRYMDSIHDHHMSASSTALLYSPAALSPSVPVRRWLDDATGYESISSPTFRGTTTLARGWSSTSESRMERLSSISDYDHTRRPVSDQPSLSQSGSQSEEEDNVHSAQEQSRPLTRWGSRRTRPSSRIEGRAGMGLSITRESNRWAHEVGPRSSTVPNSVSSNSLNDRDTRVVAAMLGTRSAATPHQQGNISTTNSEIPSPHEYVDEHVVDSRPLSRRVHPQGLLVEDSDSADNDESEFRRQSGLRGGGARREHGLSHEGTRPQTSHRSLSDFLREIEEMVRTHPEESADQDISMETTTVESQLLASSAHASLHPSARRTNYRPNHGRPNHTRPTPISIPSAEERRADYTHVGQNNSSIRNNSMSPLLAGAEAQSSSAVDSSSVSTGSHVQHRMIPISSALRRPIEVVASAGENRAAATMGDARQTLTLEGASPRYHSSQMAAFAMRSGSRALDVLYGEATDNDGAAPADPEIRGPRDNEMVEEGGAAEHPGGGVARSGFATTSASNRTIATSSQAESERDEDVHSVERRISVSQTVISQTPLPSVPGQRVFGAFVRMLPAGTEPSGYPRQRPAGADQARGRVNTNTAESTRNHLVIRSSRHLESRIPRLGIQAEQDAPRTGNLPLDGALTLAGSPLVEPSPRGYFGGDPGDKESEQAGEVEAMLFACLTDRDARRLLLRRGQGTVPVSKDYISPTWLEDWLSVGAPASHGEFRCPRACDVWELLELMLVYWAERVCAVAKGFPQPLEALDGGASGRAEREANGEYGATQAVEAAQDLRELGGCLIPLGCVREFIAQPGGPTPRDAVLLKALLVMYEGVDWATERPLYTHYREQVIPTALVLYTSLAQDVIGDVDLELGHILPESMFTISGTVQPSWPIWRGNSAGNSGRAILNGGASDTRGSTDDNSFEISQSIATGTTGEESRPAGYSLGVGDSSTDNRGFQQYFSDGIRVTADDVPDGNGGSESGSNDPLSRYGGTRAKAITGFVPGPWVIFRDNLEQYVEFYREQALALEQLLGGVGMEDIFC